MVKQYFSRLKNNLLPVTLILAISLFVSLPLTVHGLYTMHDDQQVARLYLLDKAVKSGQYPPRWVDGLGFGFGYPLFVFYPPFVYLLGEIFHISGFGFIDSIKLVFFSSIFLSGIAMYVLAKELFGKIPAITGSFFYILLPYRALDIYVRGALAESFAFAWLPLILWSFHKLTQTLNQKYLILSSAFLALLMTTHNLIFMPFMLTLPLFVLFLVWKSQDRKLSAINCLAAFILSVKSSIEKSSTLGYRYILDKCLCNTLSEFLSLSSRGRYPKPFVTYISIALWTKYDVIKFLIKKIL